MTMKPILFLTMCALSIISPSASAQKLLYFQAKQVSKTVSTPILAQMAQYTLFEMNAKSLLKQVKQQAKSSFELRIQFGAQYDWTIVLEPAKVHGDDFKFITQSGETLEVEKNITYKGYLKNDSTTKVRMTISHNYILGLILDKDNHTFEMVDKSEKLSETELFVVYDNTSSLENAVCGHDLPSVLPDLPTPLNPAPNDLLINTYCPKLGIVLDRQGLAKAGSVANFNSDLQTIINIVNGYYAALSVQYELNPVFVITGVSNPWTDAPGNPSTLIRNFANWAFANLTPNNYNCALLFTGTDMNGIGYAYIGRMCTSDKFRYGEIDYRYPQNITIRANLTSHELGHLWGAEHTASSSILIMSPIVNNGILDWGEATKTVITNNINTKFNTCLPRCPRLDVTWSYPTNAQAFFNRDSLALAVNIPENVSVGKVEFFANSVSVGSDSTRPYTINWAPPTFAMYTLKATATDNMGNTISKEIGITIQNTTSTNVTPDVSSIGLTLAPNPFSGSVNFILDVQQTTPIRAYIFNATGQYLVTLLSETLSAGSHTIHWDAREIIPPGIYYLHVSNGQQSIVRKLVKIP